MYTEYKESEIMKIHSMYIGKPKTIGDNREKNPFHREWTSAIYRSQVNKGFVTETNFVGDEVADKVHHGGIDKAIFCYPYEHYAKWRDELQLEIDAGGFGENLCVLHMNETNVCIEDKYRIGEVTVEVSQPRKPCWKPARKFQTLELSKLTEDNGRTGWYFRVLKTGEIKNDDIIELIDRPNPDWSVARCNEVLNHSKNHQDAKTLVTMDQLTFAWKKSLTKMIEGHSENKNPRLYGPNVE